MLRIAAKIADYHAPLGFRREAKFLAAMLVARLTSRLALVMRGDWPEFAMPVPGAHHPVRLRWGTTDIEVYQSVLLDGEYDIAPPSHPKVIVDAGANIGLASIYFANRTPGAAIFALEPEATNYRLLRANVAPYPRITPLNLALSGANERIDLFDGRGGHTRFRTFGTAAEGDRRRCVVQGITMDALMAQLKVDIVDLLKLDIEGAEKDVFDTCAAWIDRVDAIVAELHEHQRAGCGAAFLTATRAFQPGPTRGRTVTRIRETNLLPVGPRKCAPAREGRLERDAGVSPRDDHR